MSWWPFGYAVSLVPEAPAAMSNERQSGKPESSRGSDRLLLALGRFIVALMWAVLLAVVVFVVYLARRFSTG